MDRDLRQLLDNNRGDVLLQYKLAGAAEDTVKDYILREIAVAIEEKDWKAWDTLFGMTCKIKDPDVKADTLNNLLVMPGHQLHQEITFEIQRLCSPSSVPYIRQVLESNFTFLAYTCSEHGSIAKWFSHALARINTQEAIDLIVEYSQSGDADIAEEMRYRLARIAGLE